MGIQDFSPEYKVICLKNSAVPAFKGRTVKQWAQQSLARTSTVLTDGMPSLNPIGEVVEDHQSMEVEGGWRSIRPPLSLEGIILGVCR